MSDRSVHDRTCPLGEAMCGVEIHVEDDAVPLIRANRDDVANNLDGVRLAVAREHAGVNHNLITPGHLVDAIPGNAVVTETLVEVPA